MKNKILSTVAVLLGITSLFYGCKEEVNLPDQDETQYEHLYMPQAVNGVVTRTLMVTTDDQTLVYGANIGGRGYPENDIKVSFRVDPDLISAYNEANNTTYELPPEGSIQLSSTEAIIKKGTLSTEPLKIVVKTSGSTALKMFKSYLIPISITSDHKINSSLQTTYFLLRAEPNISEYPDYDRSGWSVIDFSTEEAEGEGPENGRAIFAFDNNINTFWHSRWKGASSSLPHHLTVDMGGIYTIHGCNFTQRQASGSAGKANLVEISYSLDNVEWKVAAEVELEAVQSQQKRWLSDFVEARYLKFTILTNHQQQYSNMAEIGAY